MQYSSQLLIRSKAILFVLIFGSFFSMGQEYELRYNENMMDFWIGGWEARWSSGDSIKLQGSNTITKILNDKVVFENFKILAGHNKGFHGQSWSVFNKKTKEWKQTWVDNQGVYLDFDGLIRGDSVIFQRQFAMNEGKIRQQRMVFYNIQKDSFTWIWQQRDQSDSNNFGPWIDKWIIFYKRKDSKN